MPSSGSREQFAAGAFDEALARNMTIEILWASHAGPVMAGRAAAGLFADTAGLAFWAWIDRGQWSDELRAIARGNYGCSIGGLNIRAQRSENFGGLPCATITQADIGHIAIGVEYPAYRDTGTWIDAEVESSPSWRIRNLTELWHTGATQHNAKVAAARMAAANAGAAPPPAARRPAAPTKSPGFVFTQAQLRAMASLGLAGRPLGITRRALADMLTARAS
jgi:phage head maturation protease